MIRKWRSRCSFIAFIAILKPFQADSEWDQCRCSSAEANCKAPFFQFPSYTAKFLYPIGKPEKSWNDAKKHCESDIYELAEPTNINEFNQLTDFVTSWGKSFWIGVKETEFGKWMYSDGITPITFAPKVRYSKTGNCVVMKENQTFSDTVIYQLEDCKEMHAFICQYKKYHNCFKTAHEKYAAKDELVKLPNTGYAISTVQKTWSQAAKFCNAHGMIFARFETIEAVKKIGDRNILREKPYQGLAFWTGGYFKDTKFKDMFWEGGNLLQTKHKDFPNIWAKNEPKDDEGKGHDLCLDIHLMDNSVPVSSVSNCHVPKYFLCFKPTSVQMNDTKNLIPKIGKQSPLALSRSLGLKVNLNLELKLGLGMTGQHPMKSWEDAIAYCKSHGLLLMTIENQNDAATLNRNLKLKPPFDEDTNFWSSGYFDTTEYKTLHWKSTNTDFPNHSRKNANGVIKVWEAGHPKDATGKGTDLCVQMKFPGDRPPVWSTSDCDELKYFICMEPRKFVASDMIKRTFDEAKEYCKKKGLVLLTIENEEENRNLNSQDRLRQPPYGENTLFWSSGRFDSTKYRKLTWTSTGETFLNFWKSDANGIHKTWEKNEPFDQGAKGLEVCVAMRFPGKSVPIWSAVDCDNPNYYICMKPPVKKASTEKPILTTTTTPVAVSGEKNKKFKSWEDATNTCKSANLYLLTIENDEDNQLLNAMNKFRQPPYKPNERFWSSARFPNTQYTQLFWASTSNEIPNFRDTRINGINKTWERDEPKDNSGNGLEVCVDIQFPGNSPPVWSASDCSKKKAYICMKPSNEEVVSTTTETFFIPGTPGPEPSSTLDNPTEKTTANKVTTVGADEDTDSKTRIAHISTDCNMAQHHNMMQLGTSKYIYYNALTDSLKTWGEANIHCRSLRTQLSIIKNEAEFNELEKELIKLKSNQQLNESTHFWIGAAIINKYAIFADGSPVISKEFPQGWSPPFIGTTENGCVKLKFDSSKGTKILLEDDECKAPNKVLCEYPKDRATCYSPPVTGGETSRHDLINIKGTHFYFNPFNKTWFDALIFCEKQGMELGSLTTEETNNIIFSGLQNHYKDGNQVVFRLWTAGTYWFGPGQSQLIWMTTGDLAGSSFPTESVWKPGEPSGDNEKCVDVEYNYKAKGLAWAASNCKEQHPFICRSPDPCHQLEHVHQGFSFQIHNKKYFYSILMHTWPDALEYCRTIGMELLSIESMAENFLVAEQIKSKVGGSSCWYWTSGIDLGQLNEFIWLTSGKPVLVDCWAKHQPDDFGGTEHCIQVNLHDNATWNDMDCSFGNNFVCEERDVCQLC